MPINNKRSLSSLRSMIFLTLQRESQIVDVSRKSTEILAPFVTIIDIDTTFVSGVEVGRIADTTA
jgi:hypothetical protein